METSNGLRQPQSSHEFDREAHREAFMARFKELTEGVESQSDEMQQRKQEILDGQATTLEEANQRIEREKHRQEFFDEFREKYAELTDVPLDPFEQATPKAHFEPKEVSNEQPEAVETHDTVEQEEPRFWKKLGSKASDIMGIGRDIKDRATNAAYTAPIRMREWLQERSEKREVLSDRRKKIYIGLAATAGVAMAGTAAYFGYDVDVMNMDTFGAPSTPEQPAVKTPELPSSEPATATVEGKPAFTESTVTVEPGDNIWDMSREALQAEGIENPTISQINDVKNASLEANDLTETTARGISAGEKIKIQIPGSYL